MGLVVSKVPASAEGHLWRIDTMSRRSLTLRPGRHFVVLIVVVVGDVQVLGTEVASGSTVLFHVQPLSMGVRVAAERSQALIVRPVEGWRHGCCVGNGLGTQQGEVVANKRDVAERAGLLKAADLDL